MTGRAVVGSNPTPVSTTSYLFKRTRLGFHTMKTILRALLLFTMGSLLFACNSTNQVAFITAPSTSSASPQPTVTWTPTVTTTPSVTPTPVYILLATQFTELRDGPNKNAKLIGRPAEGAVLVVIEKLMWLGWWYHVRVQGTNEEGWVSNYLVDPQFDTSGDDAIPVKVDVPITATPLAPTLTPVLPRNVTITFINELDQVVEVDLDGPYQVDIMIPAHGRKTVQIPAGSYYSSLSSDGYTSKSGLVTWEAGFTDTWDITFK